MSTTLPQLLPLDPAPSMELSQFRKGERAVSVMACENYAKLYAQAYGLAVWKAAMEAAAKECERYEGEQWQKYKRGHGPERASDYCQGQSDGGGDCANAIRSLPLPEQGGPQ